ncbi:hypothetical protein O6461_24715, partial [Salmonella enterica subsp. enterica]
LSGSMMTGIGSGPLLGRAASALGLPLETAFYIAALASLVGVLIFWRLGSHLQQQPNSLGAGAVSKISWASTRRVLGSKAVFAIIMVGLGG